MNSQRLRSAALTCSSRTAAASWAWRALMQSWLKRPTECSRASSRRGRSSKRCGRSRDRGSRSDIAGSPSPASVAPAGGVAQRPGTPASSEKWAKPISPASSGLAQAGRRWICSPAATARAAVCRDIWQWWRIQSMGVIEPWASYSSVAAKVAAPGREAELEQVDAPPEPRSDVHRARWRSAPASVRRRSG